MQAIGRCTAELHQALASRDDIPDFAPEPITAEDIAAWTELVVSRAQATFRMLARRRGDLSEKRSRPCRCAARRSGRVIAEIADLLPRELDVPKIRHHGDYHLGQMLVVKDDVSIIDFEGEPQRDLDERRRKAPARAISPA